MVGMVEGQAVVVCTAALVEEAGTLAVALRGPFVGGGVCRAGGEVVVTGAALAEAVMVASLEAMWAAAVMGLEGRAVAKMEVAALVVAMKVVAKEVVAKAKVVSVVAVDSVAT